MVVSFAFFFPLVILLGLHCMLVASNMTTNEYMHASIGGIVPHPYASKGWTTVRDTLCGVIPGSRLDSRMPLRPDGAPWNRPLKWCERNSRARDFPEWGPGPCCPMRTLAAKL